MAVTYAAVIDVQRILGVATAFSGSTEPTSTQVESFINAAEDEIDQTTRTAWREKTVSEEYHDFPKHFAYGASHGYRGFRGAGIPIKLFHRSVKTFDTDKNDKLEIWEGSNWVDWITDKTEGRADDFWVNYTDGRLYIRSVFTFFLEQSIRVTYRYGQSTVPSDIKEATALLAASEILSSDDHTHLVSETGDVSREAHADRISQWQKRAWDIIDKHKEFSVM